MIFAIFIFKNIWPTIFPTFQPFQLFQAIKIIRFFSWFFSGCSLLTSSGLSNLIQLRHLQELELTNCPGAAPELIEYLRQNLPKCLVLDWNVISRNVIVWNIINWNVINWNVIDWNVINWNQNPGLKICQSWSTYTNKIGISKPKIRLRTLNFDEFLYP